MTDVRVSVIPKSAARAILWVAVFASLTGCARDDKALDGFSRAYTEFRDRRAEMDTCARMPLDPESRFWVLLREALDTRGSDASRASAAAGAIDAYQNGVAPVMAVCTEYVQKMDTSVGSLIEAANRIKNDDLRTQVVGITQSARALQVAYSSLLPLYERRFDLQTAMLKDEMRAGGSLLRIPLFRDRGEELVALVRDSDQKWQQAAAAWQRTQDGFSALKGRTNLKIYPGKSDSESEKPSNTFASATEESGLANTGMEPAARKGVRAAAQAARYMSECHSYKQGLIGYAK